MSLGYKISKIWPESRQHFSSVRVLFGASDRYSLFGPLRRFRHYLRLSGVASISRRYFVMNSYDGAMTMLGVILGAYASGVSDPRFVIGAGLGASFAMGVSGLSGAFETERAERMRRLRGLRRAMLTDMRRSFHLKASLAASVWAAAVDGVSPALGASVPMVPYVLALVGVLSVQTALQVSVALILVLLFSLGAFLGRVSRGNVIFGGLRLLLVGGLTAIVLLLVGSRP